MIWTIDGKEHILSAGDPPLRINRGQVHGCTAIKGQRLVVIERNLPAGEYKARFFHDMLQTGKMPGLLMMARCSYDGDMYISLGWKPLDKIFVTVLGTIARPFVAPKLTTLRKKGE